MVSVIVPVYNVEKYLSRAIESVIAQTYSDWELILVDDGSTDSSGKICDNFQKSDVRIRAYHKENAGVSTARNFGLSKIKGDYFFFLDADDYLENKCLEKTLKCANATNADIIKVTYAHFDEGDTELSIEESSNIGLIDLTSKECDYSNKTNFASACGKLFKNKFSLIPFHTDIHYGEDFLFVVENCMKFNSMYVMADVLYYNMSRTGSAVNSNYSYRRFTELKAFELIEKILKDFPSAYTKFRCHAAERAYFHKVKLLTSDITLSKKDNKYLSSILRHYTFSMLRSKNSFNQKLAYLLAAFLPHIFKMYIGKKQIIN